MVGLDGAALGRTPLFALARQLLTESPEAWTARLGRLVFENTLQDLA
jgi:hypothetical protein